VENSGGVRGLARGAIGAEQAKVNKRCDRVLHRPLRRKPPALPTSRSDAFTVSVAFGRLLVGLRGFACHSACPPDAPRTEATDKGLPVSVRFKPSHVEFVGSAPGGGEPHQYQPGLLPR
jgi:hypothetical protein